MIPAILGIAPVTNFPAESPLEVWDRLVNGTPDRLADVKAVAKSIANGLAPLLPAGDLGVVKVALWHTTDAWTVDGPPDWYVTQVQWELCRHEVQSANVGILLSGGAWRAGTMGRDEGMQAEIVEAVRQFLECVDSRVPPDPSAAIDLSIIREMYSDADDSQIDLPAGAVPVWERLKALRTSTRRQTSEAKTLEASLRAAMKSSRSAVLSDGRRLVLRSWGNGTRLQEA